MADQAAELGTPQVEDTTDAAEIESEPRRIAAREYCSLGPETDT